MVQPATLVLALALLLGAAARAQPSPARERRERAVTVTGNPADPPPEIRVAKGVATLLRFKSRLNRDAIEVDGRGTRIKLDSGDSSIILDPLIDLGSTERLVLSVPFTDGRRAVFALVSHVSEVDTRIDVALRAQTVEACQAELAEAQARCAKISPARFAGAGLLTRKGVIAHRIQGCAEETRTAGLVCAEGRAYRAEKWALVDVTIRNEPDQPPWVLREVTLKGLKSGVLLRVRAVEVASAPISPGERGRVLVEAEPPSIEEEFTLELKGSAGRGITLPSVDLRAQESTR